MYACFGIGLCVIVYSKYLLNSSDIFDTKKYPFDQRRCSKRLIILLCSKLQLEQSWKFCT